MRQTCCNRSRRASCVHWPYQASSVYPSSRTCRALQRPACPASTYQYGLAFWLRRVRRALSYIDSTRRSTPFFSLRKSGKTLPTRVSNPPEAHRRNLPCSLPPRRRNGPKWSRSQARKPSEVERQIVTHAQITEAHET